MGAALPVTRNILVVDADASFRSFLSGLLRPRDLRVLEARGVWDVWPVLDTHEIALFVIDAQVPDEGGIALVQKLRSRGLQTPILFVASKWQGVEAHSRLTTKLDVHRVLHKPFSAYQFIMEVESTLEAPKAAIHKGLPPEAQTARGPVPRRLVSEPAFSAIDAPPASSSGGTTLLVIGRDEALRAALQEAADDDMVSLVWADSAEEATELLDRRSADGALVLLESNEHDAGFAEATELLCSEIGRGFPVGFVSHDTDIDVRVDAIRAGGVIHLTPPFRAHDLQQAIAAMAQLREERAIRLMVVADAARGAELSGALGSAEMHVMAVGDAYTLLDHLSTTTPDVILFDIDLPGVSGLDVCKLLRASPSWRALALMLIATHGSSEARIAAFDAGADDFLVKPMNEEELVARVEARVRRHRAVRESAGKDPMTGLLQRHAFVERARATLAAARRTADAVAFCVLRIADLSRLRDEDDSLISERVVLAVGRLLANLLREYDLRTRWSEDEIILALTGVDENSADLFLARLSDGLAKIRIRNNRGESVPLRFEAGVAAHPDDAHSIPALVRAARRRLTAIAETSAQV